jgi:hypothetical protein
MKTCSASGLAKIFASVERATNWDTLHVQSTPAHTRQLPQTPDRIHAPKRTIQNVYVQAVTLWVQLEHSQSAKVDVSAVSPAPHAEAFKKPGPPLTCNVDIQGFGKSKRPQVKPRRTGCQTLDGPIKGKP